jgi:hypothetical protein
MTELEKATTVAQKRRDVFQFLAARADLLCQQGSVQASWRSYRGKSLGPFFRLVYRQGGAQRSLYLGADPALAAEVRQALEELQRPLRDRREHEQRLAAARAEFKEQRRAFDRELFSFGLHLKGNQIRGWRTRRNTPQPGSNVSK